MRGSGTIFGQGRGGGRYQCGCTVGRGSGRPRVRTALGIEIRAWVGLRVRFGRVRVRVRSSQPAPGSGPRPGTWVRPIRSIAHPPIYFYSYPTSPKSPKSSSKIFQIQKSQIQTSLHSKIFFHFFNIFIYQTIKSKNYHTNIKQYFHIFPHFIKLTNTIIYNSLFQINYYLKIK